MISSTLKNKDKKTRKVVSKKETPASTKQYAIGMSDIMKNQFETLSGYYPTDIRKHHNSNLSPTLQALTHAPVKEETAVIQCFEIHKPVLFKFRSPSSPTEPLQILWDSEWEPDKKK